MASSLQLDYLQQIRFIVPYGMTPLVVVFSILGLGVEPRQQSQAEQCCSAESDAKF